MQGKRPIGRKKNVTGKADDNSMQVHGSGTGQGPVGSQDGYQEKKDQQAKTNNPLSSLAGLFSARPQYTQQTQQTQRPQQTQQTQQTQRPQQTQQTQQSGQTQRPQVTFGQSSGSQRASDSSSGLGSLLGGGGGKILIIVVIAALLLGGGGLSNLFGGGSDGGTGTSGITSGLTSLLGSSLNSGTLSSLAGSFLGNSVGMDTLTDLVTTTSSDNNTQTAAATKKPTTSTASATTSTAVRNGVLDTSQAKGSRAPYTTILGNGQDEVTVMVYMCGADLESQGAMGTKDLQEMAKAQFGDNVRLIVYTGGSKTWHVQGISNQVHQIFQVKNSGLIRLESDMGSASMTDPKTLLTFIQYCAKNFPANRYGLILWDHGCGSVSGYGYDEQNQRSGSMSLKQLNSALSQAGVKFDFIGFDACLMATVETALMASSYADYLIASEETEPGIGWYYTNWLTALGQNTSIPTIELGKQICDDFVSACNSQCRGQKTTLSVIDLAELANTVPDKLTAFSKSISALIQDKDYKTVSAARNGSREFAASNRIDQVDLTDLCFNLNTKESQALAKALRGAVKYNRINNIDDAHGLSVYFPYQKISNVETAARDYADIGMPDSYADAIRAFAKVEASGQAASGGTQSAAQSLFGGSYSSSSDDMVAQLLGAFLGGRSINVEGLNADNTGFLQDRTLTDEELTQYVQQNRFDPSQLKLTKEGNRWVLDMPVQQWAMISDVHMNAFYAVDGGYVDLGLDVPGEPVFDDQYRFQTEETFSWLAIDGQIAPYYVEDWNETAEGWVITGRVPALVDGDRVDLMISINAESGAAALTGIRYAYANGETDALAKTASVQDFFETVTVEVDQVFDYMETVQDERTSLTVQFLADLYDKDQNFQDSYVFGNPVQLTREGFQDISNKEFPDQSKVKITYRFTDIYNQHYWTNTISGK